MNDAAARVRALDPLASFIVRAPAGSGKTELLIQRYLRLLATVEQPESITAITFTKKAAGEMRARVLEALRGALGPRPETPHKAMTWELARAALDRSRAANWQLLENPARVRMQTIDSLCLAITSQMPWLARFGAVPAITEKAEPLYREAARLTLSAPDANDAVRSVLLHLDNNFGRAQNLIAQMLARRDQWLRHLRQTSLREQVERCLGGIVEQALRELREAALAAGLRDLPNPEIEAVEAWECLRDDLLTKKGEWRKMSPLAQSLIADDRLLERFKSLRGLPPARFTDAQWSAMEAIVDLLPLALAKLTIVFRERATVDFVELTLASLRALEESDGPTDLGLALGYRIQHILLDEFQDTSYTQFDLLKALTQAWEPGDGRTLFLVGDPMQSIYRFRQAEVGLFLRAWREGIGEIPLEQLTLSVNFRSDARIVNWINGIFAGAFPSEEDPVRGAVAYNASTAAYADGAHAVEIHGFSGENTGAEEAERVSALVGEAQIHGTVGILVRARSHLPRIVAELRARGIRYRAIEIDELGERPAIQDLMALTFALLHPADRISKLAVLRAPWCGLTLDELLPGAAASVRRSQIEDILAAAAANRGRVTLRELVEQTWMRLGGRLAFPATRDARMRRRISICSRVWTKGATCAISITCAIRCGNFSRNRMRRRTIAFRS